jgi:NAD(P)-dependent dehydrogenase (short-subunit alcohol dehydrogenase family)
MKKLYASLQGQVVIITGGSVGIGRAAALDLLQSGASVVVVSRNPERIADTARWLEQQVPGASVMGLALDVCSEADMQAMAGILRAGQGALHTLQQMPVSDWDEVINVNLKGAFLSNRAVLPVMLRQQSGQIINVSSTSGRKGYAFDAAYCASKFAVIGMSESLAAEVRDDGIRVQVLLPGAIDTPIWGQNGPIPKPRDVLPVDRVAQLLTRLVRLPLDAVCLEAVIEPMRVHEKPAWLHQTRLAGNQ